jgi:hypothetical protein
LSFQKWLSLLILICKTSRWISAGGLKGMAVLKFLLSDMRLKEEQQRFGE